jgi:hypothetical protein
MLGELALLYDAPRSATVRWVRFEAQTQFYIVLPESFWSINSSCRFKNTAQTDSIVPSSNSQLGAKLHACCGALSERFSNKFKQSAHLLCKCKELGNFMSFISFKFGLFLLLLQAILFLPPCTTLSFICRDFFSGNNHYNYNLLCYQVVDELS